MWSPLGQAEEIPFVLSFDVLAFVNYIERSNQTLFEALFSCLKREGNNAYVPGLV